MKSQTTVFCCYDLPENAINKQRTKYKMTIKEVILDMYNMDALTMSAKKDPLLNGGLVSPWYEEDYIKVTAPVQWKALLPVLEGSMAAMVA